MTAAGITLVFLTLVLTGYFDGEADQLFAAFLLIVGFVLIVLGAL